MANHVYIAPILHISCHPVRQRKALLRCWHTQLEDAHDALGRALRRIDGVREFAVRNGMQEHAEQLFQTWVRASYQAYLLSEFLLALDTAARNGDPVSPPSKRTTKIEGRIQ